GSGIVPRSAHRSSQARRCVFCGARLAPIPVSSWWARCESRVYLGLDRHGDRL
ncbi:MAG: hypothetical protein AVDCRST_MAG87-3465, partial [uncultured Thermomicrobiales bacterium]